VPTAAAICAILFVLPDVLEAPDFKSVFMVLLLISGVVADVIYFLQFNSNQHANNKLYWSYSIFISSVFIIIQLFISIDMASIKPLMFVFYPVGFATFSYIALKNSTTELSNNKNL
jgi:heme/copper-type cytochrome/quinol oxidase subunit 4